MKKKEKVNDGVIKGAKSIERGGYGEIKSERPFSEKDEQDQAEEKMRKVAKKRG
jgi:hypothetical protein